MTVPGSTPSLDNGGAEAMALPVGPGSIRSAHEAPDGSSPSVTIPNADDPIVGHKTMLDGSHLPLRKSEADALWAAVEAEKARRERDMPDEQSAIRQLWDAQYRLKDFGWKDPVYAPKDGSLLDILELGSTGIHRGYYEGEWPKGYWWLLDDGDMSPTRPALARASAMSAGTAETLQAAQGDSPPARPEGDAHTPGAQS